MKKLRLKSPSFNTLVNSYREWLELLGYAPSTVYNLPNHLREFFFYAERDGHMHINTITTQLVTDYYTHLSERSNQRRGGSLSKAFLNKHQQTLKLFLKYLKEHKANISFGVHLKGEKTSYQEHKTILTQEEVKLLFEACSYTHMAEYFQLRDTAILVLLYSCGLRRNEAVHINTEDILFEKQRLYVRKGKNYKERMIPMNTYNLRLLESYLYDARPEFLCGYQTDALLLSSRGTRMSDVTIALRLTEIIKATEDEDIQAKHITMHTLRHSIATHLMENNVPIKSISEFLGHSSLESTQIYVHLMNNKEEVYEDIS